MKQENKIFYNLKNTHYAPLESESKSPENGTITYTYGAVKEIPGSVSLALSAIGELKVFYADGIAYFVGDANNGYEGDMIFARIPDDFRKSILNETLDSKGVLFEDADKRTNPFALFFEFDGDVNATKYCMLYCKTGRPDIASKTKEEIIEPGTEKLPIKCSPRSDGLVRALTTAETDPTAYADWYKSVPTPQAPAA